MKILFSDTTYSYLFPGGKQVHADKLFHNLNELGIEIEYENWHNPTLKGDIIQFFGFNDFHKIKTLKSKGYKLVYTHILDGLTNLSKPKLIYHQLKNKLIRLLPEKFNVLFPWKALSAFDALIYMHENDRKTAIKLYNVDPNKAFVIPHAVDTLDQFKGEPYPTTDKYLISLGSIVDRKNAVFTANICRELKIPILFVGHPFDQSSSYYNKFISQVDDNIVRYKGYVTESEKINLLKKASGFVLLSFGESGCISVYEAAATGLPLLLSDLPWAKGYENPINLQYCSPSNIESARVTLQHFYNSSSRKEKPSFTVYTWKDIAMKYAELYQNVLES